MRRIDADNRILVEQRGVFLNKDFMVKPVAKSQPSGAVGQRVAVGLYGIVQRRPHAIAGFAVPFVGICLRVDAGSAP